MPDPQFTVAALAAGGNGVGRLGSSFGAGDAETLSGTIGSRVSFDPSVGNPGQPQGLTNESFTAASNLVSAKVQEMGLGGDIFIQGSRASKTALPLSDIDIGIRLTEDHFNDFLNNDSRLSNVNPGSAKERTLNNAIDNGLIQSGEARLSPLRVELETLLRIPVDLSIVRAGGNFDNGVQIPLRPTP